MEQNYEYQCQTNISSSQFYYQMTMSSVQDNNHTTRIDLCSKVAQELGINYRWKPLKWYSNKKNWSRHKLRQYCLGIEKEAQFVQTAFSFIPQLDAQQGYQSMIGYRK